MTILAQDTFTRSNISGNWGTASDGNTWTQLRGTQTPSIASNEGVLTYNGSTTTGIMVLSAGTATTVEGLVRFSVSSLTDLAGITLRAVDSNNFYSCLVGNTSQTITFRKNVAGTFSTVGTAVSFTYTTNTFYWLRFRISGTTLNAKIWADGSAESTATTMTATDSSISSAGRYGLVGTPITTGNTTKYDNVSFNDTSTAFLATLAGTGTLSGTLSLSSVALSVTMAGTGTLSGATGLSTSLTSTLSAVGTLAASPMGLATALTDTLAGTGTLAATSSYSTALTGTFTGVGTVAFTLSASSSLAGTCAGTSTLSGVLSLQVALFLVCAGVGQLSGNLTGGAALVQYLSAIWVTRDRAGTWKTRDLAGTWKVRDESGTWRARDEQGTWDTRDDQATWKTR